MSLMEFWGAEVKSGESLEVDPGQGVVLHLSQASIGEVKKDKANERICLFVKVDDQKLTLGTVSSEKLPQISFDLVFEKKFQLSHNWKKGSVYFTGYRAYVPKDVITDESSESDTYFDTEPNSEEGFRVDPHHIGKSELEVKQAAKPNVTTAKQVRIVEPNKVEDTDEDTSSDEESSDESDDDEAKAISEEESSENDDDGSDGGSDDDSSKDEDKETPKEAKANKKRPMEPAKKTPADKKAKFISPEKTDVKKFSGHVATPHPSKQTVTKQQTPKSGGAYPCKSCNRSFSSETGLQSHTKAKHSAAQ